MDLAPASPAGTRRSGLTTVAHRELIVLGTASAAPTRLRNQNGYALKWEDRLFLFDPGEGFQRQCLVAGVSIARADAVFISHFHGDHCLGLPGVMYRRMIERPDIRLPVFFPAGSQAVFDHLVRSTVTAQPEVFDPRPLPGDRPHAGRFGELDVVAARLEHPVPTLGYRLTEPDRTGLDGDLLDQFGIHGPDVARLEAVGHVESERGDVELSRFIRRKSGLSMAFVMDTALCDAAIELAAGVDLLVCEATHLDTEHRLARASGHMTARDAGWLAREAGARRLVLTHFSQRYDNLAPFAEEAADLHPDVVVAKEFDRIPVPARMVI